MPLDPSIPLQSRPAQLPNPLELAQHMATLRQLGLQSQASQLGIEQSQRSLAQEKTLADLYRNNVDPTTGTVNSQGVIGGMASSGLGEKIPGYQKSLADASKSQTDQQTSEFELHKKRLDMLNSGISSLLSKPNLTHDDVVAQINNYVTQGLITPEQGAEAARNTPGRPDQLKPFLMQKSMEAMDVSKQLEARIAAAPKYNEQDRGNVINQGTVDPTTGQRTAGADVAKEMTPDQKAKIDLQKSGALTDDAKSFIIDRLLNGEKASAVLGNMGRGAQGAADLRDIMNRLPVVAHQRGIQGDQLANIMQNTAADARTLTELGAREGKIAPRVQEAQNFANMALKASADVPRGNWTDATKFLQWGAAHTSDPKFGRFQIANNSLINAYAAAIGGGVMHVEDQKKGAQMLSTASGPEDYAARVDQLIKETQGALDAPGQVRGKINAAAGRTPAKSADVPTESEVDAILKKHGGK